MSKQEFRFIVSCPDNSSRWRTLPAACRYADDMNGYDSPCKHHHRIIDTTYTPNGYALGGPAAQRKEAVS